jgi:transcriptional regulator with XRE-family HTH domain
MADYQYSIIGKRFKKLRIHLNLSHETIAQRFDISTSFVYQLESGRTLVPNYLMVWLAQEHKANLNCLADEVGPMILENNLYLKPNSASQEGIPSESEKDAEIANLKEQVSLLKQLVLLNSKN